MAQVHERWFADPGVAGCRLCSGKDGALFSEPNKPWSYHLDCLLASWQRGEQRRTTLAKREAHIALLQAEVAQLRALLADAYRTVPNVAGFAGDLARVAAGGAPAPSAARGSGFAIAPKPAPAAPKPPPEPEKPRPDRFSLIDLD